MSDAPDEARTAEFRKQFESLREVLLPGLANIAEISELARLLLEDEEGIGTLVLRALCEMLRVAEDHVSPISPPQSSPVLTAAWNEATGWRDFLSSCRGWVIASSNDPEIADRLRRRLNEMMANSPRSALLQEASQNRKTPQDCFDELKAKCPSLREIEERADVKLELPNDNPPMKFLPKIPPELGSVLSALLDPMFSAASKRFDEDVYLPLARQFESLANLPQQKALPCAGVGAHETRWPPKAIAERKRRRVSRPRNARSGPRRDEPQSLAAPTLPIALGGPDDAPIVRGIEKDILTPTEYRVVKAMLDAFPKRLAGDNLARKSEAEDPVGAIDRLIRDKDWASVLSKAGKPHGGYGIVSTPRKTQKNRETRPRKPRG